MKNFYKNSKIKRKFLIGCLLCGNLLIGSVWNPLPTYAQDKKKIYSATQKLSPQATNQRKNNKPPSVNAGVDQTNHITKPGHLGWNRHG